MQILFLPPTIQASDGGRIHPIIRLWECNISTQHSHTLCDDDDDDSIIHSFLRGSKNGQNFGTKTPQTGKEITATGLWGSRKRFLSFASSSSSSSFFLLSIHYFLSSFHVFHSPIMINPFSVHSSFSDVFMHSCIHAFITWIPEAAWVSQGALVPLNTQYSSSPRTEEQSILRDGRTCSDDGRRLRRPSGHFPDHPCIHAPPTRSSIHPFIHPLGGWLDHHHQLTVKLMGICFFLPLLLDFSLHFSVLWPFRSNKTGQKPVTPEVRDLALRLRPEITQEAMARGMLQAADLESFEPLDFSSQVVAGMNYKIGIRIREGRRIRVTMSAQPKDRWFSFGCFFFGALVLSILEWKFICFALLCLSFQLSASVRPGSPAHRSGTGVSFCFFPEAFVCVCVVGRWMEGICVLSQFNWFDDIQYYQSPDDQMN